MTGTVWIASYVALWLLLILLGFTCIALLRQVGVLHARLRPQGVHFAGEGPPIRSTAPGAERFGYERARLTLLMFTSPSCAICKQLRPGLAALQRQYPDVAFHEIEQASDTSDLFFSFNVRSTPYFVAVDEDGIVKVRGVGNSVEQIEVMIEESMLPFAEAASEEAPVAG